MSTEISSDEQLPGAVTGGYRLLSKIGSGTMGHVYEAEDTKTGKHVALKVLRKSKNEELTARFVREGKTLALLSHPNIVQLVDMGQLDDGTLFLATELVPGGSLRELMDRGPLGHPRALRLIRQLLDALQAAHDLGVVHRDIKPENVMIADGDIVKVLDFGVAKLLQDTVAGLGEANLTSVGFSIFGSALYISPESATGEKLDGRSDIYSTGAMLFEMLAGRPPFDNEDPMAILRAQAFEAPPTQRQAAPLQTFASELEALVARALAKKPDDRYRSAADMVPAVDAALQIIEPAPTLPAVSVAERPRSRSPGPEARLTTQPFGGRGGTSRNQKLAIAGVGGTLLLVLVIALLVRDNRADASKQSGAASSMTHPISRDGAATFLARGHEQFGNGHIEEALSSYERALRGEPTIASDPKLRAVLSSVLEGKDVLPSIVALDLLASLAPPASDVIAGYASKGKLEPARHRAMMLAERDGFASKVDSVQSWILDVQQATSCEDRKTAIELLANNPDRRALAVLKRMRAIKCVEQEAASAIARIDASAK
jgi:serine/threonine protein kinase